MQLTEKSWLFVCELRQIKEKEMVKLKKGFVG